jgi:DNA-binding beta-propeller fold protein YncE
MHSFAGRLSIAVGAVLIGVALHAQEGPGVGADLRSAFAQQEAIEKAAPQLELTEEVLPLVVPGHTIGEAVGVAKNSKGNLFVFSRSGTGGPVRGAVAAELFEFDRNLKFVKQWGPGNYAAAYAHTVRVDKDDNVWISDEGSHMIVKFDPKGQVSMVLGRKPEAVDYFERFIEHGNKEERTPPARRGVFNRPTDVAFDPEGNIYISDGYNNSRVVKLAKDGTWLKETGTRGSAPDQFNTVHAITADKRGNIYVGDRGNRRIKVYDTELNLKNTYTNVGAPWSVCVTPGEKQFLYSGDSNGKIYKLDLDGKLLGWAQLARNRGQTSCLIHELHCESETVVYKGDCATWTVEKLTLKAAK